MKTTFFSNQFRNSKAYLLFFVFTIAFLNLKAQTAGDYRTNRASVNWNNNSHWDYFNGASWVGATNYPGQAVGAGTVLIQNGHSVTLNVSPPNAIGSLIVGEGTSGSFTTSNNDRTLNITNNLLVSENAVFDLRRIFLTVGGNTTINGTLNDSNNSGDATFVGMFTIGATGTYSTTSTSPLIFRGGITNNGTFNRTGNGAITFNTNNQTINGIGSFSSNGTITVTAITVTNNASNVNFTRTNNGALAGTGTWVQGAGGVLNYAGGTMIVANVDFTTNPNTVNYNSTAAQTIRAVNYSSLAVSSSGIKTLVANTIVNGNLTIAGTSTLACGTFQITGNASGVLTMENGATLTLGATGNAANILFPTNFTNGNIVLGETSTVIYQNNNTQTVSHIPTYGNLIIATGGNKAITGNASISGNLTISAGTFDLGTSANSLSVLGAAAVNGTLTFNGTTTKTVGISGNLSGTGTINMSGGNLNHILNLGGATNAISTFTTAAVASTVNYNRAGAQTIFTSTNYRNLTVSGSGTKTLQGNTTVNNDLNISEGTLEVNSRTFTVNGNTFVSGTFSDNNNTGTNTFVGLINITGTGNFTTANSSPFVFRGGIVNDGTFNKTGTGAVTFNTNSQSISGIGSFSSNGTITVTGVTVTNSANISFTSIANGALAGTGTWVQGENSALNYSGGTITISIVDFATNNNTVNYSRNGAQTIRATEYSNLNLSSGNTKSLSGATIVNGNLIIISPTTLDVTASNHALSIAGNWNNSGTFNARSGTVTFNGSTQQNILSNANNFFNVVFNNTASGWGAITLNDDVTITNQCTMTDGIIATGANHLILTSTTAANLSGFSNASYVNGNLRRHIANNTATYAFPVGNTANYYRADIKNNNLNGITFINAKYSSLERHNDNDLVVNDGVELSYTSIVSNMWTIDPNTAPSSGSYDIYLYTTNVSGLSDNQFAAVKRPTGSPNASSWTTGGGTINAAGGDGRKAADGYALRMGLTSFSEFGIASTESGNPLPVQLVLFSAKLNEEKIVDFTWITATEINNDFFTIERSADAINFEEVLSMSGAGNSNITLTYKAEDPQPLAGVSYYRLKQTDSDGTYTYSAIVSVNNKSDNTVTIKEKEWKVFPNPVKIGSAVFIDTENFDTEVKVIVYEAATGKEVVNTLVEDKYSIIQLNENLKSGTYLMRIIEGEKTTTKRIIVQ